MEPLHAIPAPGTLESGWTSPDSSILRPSPVPLTQCHFSQENTLSVTHLPTIPLSDSLLTCVI